MSICGACGKEFHREGKGHHRRCDECRDGKKAKGSKDMTTWGLETTIRMAEADMALADLMLRMGFEDEAARLALRAASGMDAVHEVMER